MNRINKMLNTRNYCCFLTREKENKKVQNRNSNNNNNDSKIVNYGGGGIAGRWRILSGENQWEGLLDPLDSDLRRYIIHYGEMAQATYDNFIRQKASKFAGDWRYPRQSILGNVGLVKGNPFKYSVTRYVYATSSVPVPDAFILKSDWNRESNWIGFIAVATEEGAAALGRRDILVAWRGTVRNLEWVDDFACVFSDAPEIFGGKAAAGPKVHLGWYSIYTSRNPKSPVTNIGARDQVLAEVKRLVELYKNEEVSITTCGHSLGASLATLNAVDIATNGANKPSSDGKAFPVTAFAYACPRTGDHNFKKAIKTTPKLRLLRVRNVPDIVPQVPPATLLTGYADVGVELAINVTKSSYVKAPGELSSWHSLESYLHGIAGTKGVKTGDGFELVVGRGIALVNKSLDYLKEEYGVPQKWWTEKNRGMVQEDDGSWKLMDHEEGYTPTPP
ncbi:hypothetical protein DM860_001985 [Cuscuta australis]|uniref:Phospholipase A1 n=1 Tax=Cuscuta australis TaxID=267555 RepID=A0A328DVG7_9ASTE|nr:hypothetical protein DM860_001985 [Cuscuta australis]